MAGQRKHAETGKAPRPKPKPKAQPFLASEALIVERTDFPAEVYTRAAEVSKHPMIWRIEGNDLIIVMTDGSKYHFCALGASSPEATPGTRVPGASHAD